MKKIGEGYFYKVYDLGNGRVLKKHKSKLRLFWYILIANWFLPRAFREYKNALRNIPAILNTYQTIRERFSDLGIFGNPIFREWIDYEQDKALIIRKVLKTKNEDEIKELIEGYILSVKELWKYGCHEKVFNFTINNGVDRNGKVIFIDFNELSFDKEYVKGDIINKTWKHRWSYTHLYLSLKKDFRVFYSKRMAEELTFENLDILWDAKSDISAKI